MTNSAKLDDVPALLCRTHCAWLYLTVQHLLRHSPNRTCIQYFVHMGKAGPRMQAMETYTSTPAPARALLRRIAGFRFTARPMQARQTPLHQLPLLQGEASVLWCVRRKRACSWRGFFTSREFY